jgi:hypothetical protein
MCLQRSSVHENKGPHITGGILTFYWSASVGRLILDAESLLVIGSVHRPQLSYAASPKLLSPEINIVVVTNIELDSIHVPNSLSAVGLSRKETNYLTLYCGSQGGPLSSRSHCDLLQRVETSRWLGMPRAGVIRFNLIEMSYYY